MSLGNPSSDTAVPVALVGVSVGWCLRRNDAPSSHGIRKVINRTQFGNV